MTDRETVARALYKADSGFDPDTNVFEGKPAWMQYDEQADAAIAALRPRLMEEAANVAEEIGRAEGAYVAMAIRAMKEKQP